jgi:magnesium transporter
MDRSGTPRDAQTTLAVDVGGPPEASAQATARVPTARPGQLVGDVRAALVGSRFDCADDVAVVASDRLVGMVPIERLLAAAESAHVDDIMDGDPPVVSPGADQERVAWEMVRRGESSVAVVDGRERFVGLIPPHRMLRVALREHDEDVARLGGYMASTQRARQAAEEAIARRLWHRLPWLLLGLAGAFGAAVIVGGFQAHLEEEVLLAFFLPGVVYMSAAIGTQTQTVVIRGFSVGVTMRDTLRRELTSGVLLSAAIAAAFVPVALVGWGDFDLAFGVGLALFGSSLAATAIALLLPWLFQRLGADPAFGSGPLATVLQDIFTIAIYFAVASPIAT